jgi:hypothetical protein
MFIGGGILVEGGHNESLSFHRDFHIPEACTHVKTKHAVKQVDRLLSNEGIDGWDSFTRWGAAPDR